MSEMAVEIEDQQNIVTTLDQGVRIGQHTACQADSSGEPALLGWGQRSCEGGPQQAMGNQIHAISRKLNVLKRIVIRAMEHLGCEW
jgi:hypothetical protein